MFLSRHCNKWEEPTWASGCWEAPMSLQGQQLWRFTRKSKRRLFSSQHVFQGSTCWEWRKRNCNGIQSLSRLRIHCMGVGWRTLSERTSSSVYKNILYHLRQNSFSCGVIQKKYRLKHSGVPRVSTYRVGTVVRSAGTGNRYASFFRTVRTRIWSWLISDVCLMRGIIPHGSPSTFSRWDKIVHRF